MSEPSSEDKRIQTYISDVLEQVRFREVHTELARELRHHLADAIESLTEQGEAENNAVAKAIAQMGSASDVGRALDAVHRPRLDWWMVVSAAVLMCMGCLCWLSLAQSHTVSDADATPLWQSLIGLGVGVAVVFMMARQRIERWHRYFMVAYLLAVGVLVALITREFVTVMTSRPFIQSGEHALDTLEALLVPLFLGTIALLLRRKRGPAAPLLDMLILAVPILLFIRLGGMVETVQYTFLSAIVWASVLYRQWGLRHVPRVKKLSFAIALVVSFGLIASAVLLNSWRSQEVWYRLHAFIHPDSLGGGYAYHIVRHAAASSGWTGQGFGAKFGLLPYVASQMPLIYLVYALGWGFGILIVGAMIVLFARLFRHARMIVQPLARTYVMGLGALFLFQCLYALLMNFGLLPIAGVRFPFISVGPVNFIFHAALLGILLGIYRRRFVIQRPLLAGRDS